MESAREIIEISSGEDEVSDIRVPVETRVHPGGKRKGNDGGGNDLPEGASLDVSDNDDCLILDGFSESVAAGVEYVELGGEVLDEMLIVGEKGQFACRDYPHPRYLCATFLFNTTPHKKHCDMCHCYVCDCPAPCIYWENHCSSTHKEHSWRAERKSFRRRKTEQHQHFDVKPVVSGLNRPVSKPSPFLLSPNVTAKSAAQHGPRSFNVKPALPGPNLPVSKSSLSLLLSNDEPKSAHHHDPVQHTEITRCRESPHRSTETAASHPKDILCEIYKICPTVISCRRRIPPSLQPDEVSDTDLDD